MTLATLPSPNFTGADLSARVNAALLEVRASRRFATVASLLADASMAYGTGARAIAAGDVIEAGGHRYEVAASAATDHQLATAGGVRLKVLPGPNGAYNFAAMAPAMDGTTDDFPKLRLLLDAVLTGTGWYPSGPAIFFPNRRYFMGQTIELKSVVRLMGNGSGLPFDSGPELVFPTNTTGIVVNRYNTLNGAVQGTPTTAADSTIIEGINLSSTRGNDTTKHGINLLARAHVRNVRISGFSGNGVNIVADVNTSGNANCFHLDTMRIQGNGGCGVYAQGGDANAGAGYSLDCARNALWGIWDASFLGNTWDGCHMDANGRDSVNGRSAYATFGGASYHAVPGATETQLRTTQPGTNAAIWRACNSTSYAIAWTGSNPEGTYRQGGGLHSSNANARCTFEGCYVEGGQGLTWGSQHTLFLGGFLVEVPVASGAALEGRFSNVWSRSAFASEATGPNGGTVTAHLGGNPDNGDVLRITASGPGAAAPVQDIRLKYSGGDLIWNRLNGGTTVSQLLTGASTTQQMGTGAAVPDQMVFPRIAIGSGLNIRRQGNGTAIPTTGAWARGDIVWNVNVVAGGYVGWVCTAAGTPGTWKGFGLIEA